LKQDIPSLLVFLLAVFMTAIIGSWFAPGPWYAALNKPSWTPPNWLFGPVWSLLYVAIAVAGWRVWRQPTAQRPTLLLLWSAQLILNGAWSWLFFGLRAPGLALLDIVLLLCVIVFFVAAARSRNRVAAWLFVPYGLWVGFATALNFSIWRINPL
jgi:translocator protein